MGFNSGFKGLKLFRKKIPVYCKNHTTQTPEKKCRWFSLARLYPCPNPRPFGRTKNFHAIWLRRVWRKCRYILILVKITHTSTWRRTWVSESISNVTRQIFDGAKNFLEQQLWTKTTHTFYAQRFTQVLHFHKAYSDTSSNTRSGGVITAC